jgi:D-alanyl-D-alanine carboxypeptidase/D-alanyl-D-alanine-endopeptidase (penicillin-binding protein 4)
MRIPRASVFSLRAFSRRRLLCGLFLAAAVCVANGLGCANFAAAQTTPQARKAAKATAQNHKLTAAKDASARADVAVFRARVRATLGSAHADEGYWGVLVTDRNTGETLYDLNSGRFFAPASNAKLFTTAFALAALGPNYKYRTTLESKGALGADGRLSGDLILVGRGDPDLSNRKFPYAGKAERDGPVDKVLAELADTAVAKGLKEVDGNIVGDDSYFPYDPYPEGWSAGDLYFEFGAPVSAIAFNDNTISIVTQPGAQVGDPAILDVLPGAASDTYGHEVTTVAGNLQPDFAVVRRPGTNYLLLRGAIPLGHAPVTLDFAMMDPAEIAARTLKQLLEERGVLVLGSASAQHGPAPARSQTGALLQTPQPTPTPPEPNPLVLAEHFSPPLLESIRLTNKISQNLHAEMFLRTVAREKTGVGSIDEGVKLEQQFLKTAGIADGDVVFSDGSGLARDDLVTPRAAEQLLRYAISQPWGKDFLSTLPIAGVDGTLDNRMQDSRATGLIEAKTGSTEHVHALSGYATTLRGEFLIFSIFGNNDTQKAHDASLTVDAIATAMIETLGSPPHPKAK